MQKGRTRHQKGLRAMHAQSTSSIGAFLSFSMAAGAAVVAAAGASRVYNERQQQRRRRRANSDAASASAASSSSSASAALVDGGEDGELENDEYKLYVGLARVCAPRNVGQRDELSDRVKNDIVLEMAIKEVEEVLYIYVDAQQDKHAAVNYVSELYNLTWDLQCLFGKQHLEINIISSATAATATSQANAGGSSGPTWDELVAIPDLGAIYGELGDTISGAKSLPRHNLLPVACRSPLSAVQNHSVRGAIDFDNYAVMDMNFDVVIVNGTFDHLHNGHKRLLGLALSICKSQLVVGIVASQELLDSKPFAHLIEPLETRKKHVVEFVASCNKAIDVQVVDLYEEDEWGPTKTAVDAVTVISTTDIVKFKRMLSLLPPSHPGPLVRIARRTERSTLSSSRIRAQLATQG